MKKTLFTSLILLSSVAAMPALAQNCASTEECTKMYNSKVEYKPGAYAAPETPAPSKVEGDYSKVDDKDGKFSAYNIPQDQVKQNTVGTIVTKIYVPPSAPVNGENYIPVTPSVTAPDVAAPVPVAPLVAVPAVAPTVPAMTRSVEPSIAPPVVTPTIPAPVVAPAPVPVELPPVSAAPAVPVPPPADMPPITKPSASTDLPPMPPMPGASVETPAVSDSTLLAPPPPAPTPDVSLTMKPAKDGSGMMDPSLTTSTSKAKKSFGAVKEKVETLN